jgi:hypothetical protein
MLEYVPVLMAAGIPESRPVLLLKLAQEGAFAMLKTIYNPLGSVALGWKE